MGKLLYGYLLKKGKVSICKQDAKYVKAVIKMCIEEVPPTQIARLMNEKNIPTLKQGGKWSHSMITKMIQNLRYSGADDFPSIVSRNEQLKAIHILENRIKHKKRIQSENRNKASPFYKLVYCGECQQRMRLYKKQDIEYWKCTSVAYSEQCMTHELDDYIEDKKISILTLEVVNDLIKNKYQVVDVGKRKMNLLNLVYVENEIKQLLKEETKEIEKLNSLIQEKYVIKYKELENVFISETMILKKYLNSLPIQKTLCQEVMKQIFRRITIYSSGRIEYELMNHQVIKKAVMIERGKLNGKNT